MQNLRAARLKAKLEFYFIFFLFWILFFFSALRKGKGLHEIICQNFDFSWPNSHQKSISSKINKMQYTVAYPANLLISNNIAGLKKGMRLIFSHLDQKSLLIND